MELLWTILKIAAAIYVAAAVLLYLFQDKLIYPAPRGGEREPRNAGLDDAELLTIRGTGAAENCNLHGYLLFPRGVERRGLATILLFHGNGENVTFDAGWLESLRAEGFAAACVDYPGYGLSDGKPSEDSLIASGFDALAALRARPELDPSKIVLLGSSIGTGVAVAVAARESVAGLILQSPFDSLANVAMRHYPIFPRFLLKTDFNSLARIGNVHAPILILHGDADRVVPIQHGRALHAAAPNARPLQVVEGAGHNDVPFVAKEQYFAWIRAFVRDVTGGGRAVPR